MQDKVLFISNYEREQPVQSILMFFFYTGSRQKCKQNQSFSFLDQRCQISANKYITITDINQYKMKHSNRAKVRLKTTSSTPKCFLHVALSFTVDSTNLLLLQHSGSEQKGIQRKHKMVHIHLHASIYHFH